MSPYSISALPERLQKKLRIDPVKGCWMWIGATWGSHELKYGCVRINYRAKTAHRVIYELLVEPIPEGLEIDHLCYEPLCCNPEHLEAVTQEENNNRRRPKRRRTYCLQGHEFTPENTFTFPDGRRRCRICTRTRDRKYYVKRPREWRTHCRQGHEFTPENTIIQPKDGRRRCRICKNAGKRIWRQQRHLMPPPLALVQE